MSDLLLKTHFNELKEELDKQIRSTKDEEDNEVVNTLKEILTI